MYKKMILALLLAMILCSCWSQHQEKTFSDIERQKYENYPLHLLALQNKTIKNSAEYDMSLINEYVHGRTPIQLLVEAQYQNNEFKNRKSIKAFKSFIDHGADIYLLLEDGFRKKIDIITLCLNIFDNDYLKVFLQNYNQMLPCITEQGGNYLMLACYYENFSAVPLLLPYIKDINGELKLGQTALHYAAAYSAPYKTIKLLLENGADGTMKDIDERTPYDLYLCNNPDKFFSKTASLLMEASK